MMTPETGKRKAEKNWQMKTELETPTKVFTVAVVKDIPGFPRNVAAEAMGRQPTRSASSIGANHRKANRAETRADFIHKIGLAGNLPGGEVEAPESIPARLTEAGELPAILVTLGKNARRRSK